MSEWHMHKLDNGSYTAVWAANRIRRLEKALEDLIAVAEECDGWECDGWESYPSLSIAKAEEALKEQPPEKEE